MGVSPSPGLSSVAQPRSGTVRGQWGRFPGAGEVVFAPGSGEFVDTWDWGGWAIGSPSPFSLGTQGSLGSGLQAKSG
jgi:hypothetical protein